MPALAHAFLALLLLLAVSGGACGEALWRAVDALTLAGWLRGEDPPQVLDVRGREAYQEATVPGAQGVGMDPAGFVPDGRGGRVVLLLDPPLDARRLTAWAERLADAGHAVYLLDGGIPAWRAAGLDIETGAARFTLPGSVPFTVPRGLCEQNQPAQEFR